MAQPNQPRRRKKGPIKSYTFDAQFWSVEIRVKAHTEGEARKKALVKLSKKNPCTFLNRGNSYVNREY